MDYKLENEYMSLVVKEFNDTLTINGTITAPLLYTKMVLFGANPIDRMMNYVGSGLAFPNPQIAFENSQNTHLISETGLLINVVFKKPNAYYSVDTLTMIPPSLFMRLEGSGSSEPILIHFDLKNNLPLKTVFYRDERAKAGPYFYEKKATIIGVQSQYNIIQQIGDVKRTYGCG